MSDYTPVKPDYSDDADIKDINDNLDEIATAVATKVDTAGTGLTKSGTTLAITNTEVTAGSYGPSENKSPSFGGNFNVPYVTVNEQGQLTAASTKVITLPTVFDSGWQTPVPNCKYRKWGELVTVIVNTHDDMERVLFTLPSGYRPVSDLLVPNYKCDPTDQTHCYLKVASGGNVSIVPMTTSRNQYLAGCCVTFVCA